MRVPAGPGRGLRVDCPATASSSPRACPWSGCRALVSRSRSGIFDPVTSAQRPARTLTGALLQRLPRQPMFRMLTTSRCRDASWLEPGNGTCATTGAAAITGAPSRSALRRDRSGSRSPTTDDHGPAACVHIGEFPGRLSVIARGCSLGWGLVSSPMPLDLGWPTVSPVCSRLCASCVDPLCPSVAGGDPPLQAASPRAGAVLRHGPPGEIMKKTSLLAASSVAALGIGLLAGPAVASEPNRTTYHADLDPVNHSGGSGTLTLSLSGRTATVTERVRGLASTFDGQPYPHVQHIHVDARHECPTPSADTSGDGVVSTTEGHPFYGDIGTTLTTSGDTSPAAATTLTPAPSGRSFVYRRTVTLDDRTAASIRNGTAVIVVHGLDPSTLPPAAQDEPSALVPSLPLAATSPALCGPLNRSHGGHLGARR